MKKILVLAPHTDDGELGCGATMSKMLREGVEIFYTAFSSCKETIGPGLPSNILEIELMNAMGTLGISREKVRVLDFSVRNFGNERQRILDCMIELNKSIEPDLVFMPSNNDTHQDHKVIAEEGLRAFKHTSILCYEVPWNNYQFRNQAFSIVDERDVKNKIEAVACYKTQEHRAYTTEEFIRALLVTHGVQCGAKYAEVFETPRWIL